MSGEAKLVTVVLLRDGDWGCWGCEAIADLPDMPQEAYDAGSAHIVAAIPHKPGCVLDSSFPA